MSVLWQSPQLNGNDSSKGMPLTSIKSLHHCTMLSLIKREQVTWEIQKLFLESLKVRKKFLLHQNGCQPGEKLLKPLDSHFLIRKMNSLNTETISNVNLLLNSSHPTINSSSTTSPSKMKLLAVNIHELQTITDSPDSILPLSSLTASKPIQNNQTTKNPPNIKATISLKSAMNSTLECAKTLMLIVDTVCAGLHKGFCPWADTLCIGFSSTHDES